MKWLGKSPSIINSFDSQRDGTAPNKNIGASDGNIALISLAGVNADTCTGRSQVTGHITL